MQSIAVLAWQGCAWGEVMPALTLLEGARVMGAGSVRVREGFVLQTEPLGHADLLIVPGGELDAAWEDEALLAVIRTAPAVAGICNGALLIARAGRAVDRRVTHTAHAPWATRPEWAQLLAAAEPALAGSHYVDEDVVIDGDVLTAKPWAAIPFAQALAERVLPREEAARRARYLRGTRDLPGEDPYQRWACFFAPIPGVVASREQVDAHIEHLRGLERTGRLALAGPFGDGSGGLVVFRARDEAEAQALVARDPFATEGVRTLTLRRWMLSCADNDHMGRPAGRPPSAG